MRTANLVLILCFLVAIAQAQFPRSRFLVKGQPEFVVFNFNSTIGLQNTTLVTDSGTATFRHDYHAIGGFLLPLATKENLIAAIGGGYAQDRFRNLQIDSISNKHQLAWVQGVVIGNIWERTFYRLAGVYGSHSSAAIDLSDNSSHKYSILAQYGLKWSEDFSTSLGLLVLSDFGERSWLPTAQIIYGSNRWIFNFLIPLDESIRYMATKNLHFLARFRVLVRSYWFLPTNRALNYSPYQLSVRSQFRLYSFIWGEVGFAHVLPLDLEWIQGRPSQLHWHTQRPATFDSEGFCPV